MRVPPAWVVADWDTAARAEAGDVDAMGFVAKGYMELAASENIEAGDEERQAMLREALAWVNRRVKIIADREGDVESVRKRAEAGDAAAQRNLGYRYSLGVDVEKDESLAFEWTKKAAEQGNPEAQQNLGLCLFYGEGCEENRAEAAEWYRKAAEQGEAGAMFNLGACYKDGTGVPEDPAEAVVWFRRAAALGHPRAAAVLEQMAWE